MNNFESFLFQTVTTTIGIKYNLSYYLKNLNSGYQFQFKAQVNGTDISGSSINTTTSFDWTSTVVTFTATSTSSTITFWAFTDLAALNDAYIDNISVKQNTAPCFGKGTKVLCYTNNEEKYIPIEKLKKGDIVKTYKHGYRKIYDIIHNYIYSNPNFFGDCMYVMKKYKDINLIDDLYLIGGHSILVDTVSEYEREKIINICFGMELFIDDKQLLPVAFSKQFDQIKERKYFTYYQFTIENDGNNDQRFGVWANGILVETPSVNQFQNLFK